MPAIKIERRFEVLAGEPVIEGTRVAARHVAALVERGVAPVAIADDLDLSLEQIEAAVAFTKRASELQREPAGAGRRNVSAAG